MPRCQYYVIGVELAGYGHQAGNLVGNPGMAVETA
jgi:hypothetical protein